MKLFKLLLAVVATIGLTASCGDAEPNPVPRTPVSLSELTAANWVCQGLNSGLKQVFAFAPTGTTATISAIGADPIKVKSVSDDPIDDTTADGNFVYAITTEEGLAVVHATGLFKIDSNDVAGNVRIQFDETSFNVLQGYETYGDLAKRNFENYDAQWIAWLQGENPNGALVINPFGTFVKK